MQIKKAVKKTAIGLLVLGQMTTTGVLAAPQEAINDFKDVKEVMQDIGYFKGEIKLYIEKDGKRTRVDQNMKDGLRVVEGRTCVGVRDLVNVIEGAEVEWDQANKIVDIKYDGKEISYPLNKPVMWNGDKMVTIDVPAQVDPKISRTFLPIRNIAETLGFKVDWNQETKEVTLTPGAGTDITTTQQPKATTNTNTENLAWVTASGQKIPKRDELPAESEKRSYIVKIEKEDITENPDRTTTYFKGTVLEFTTQAKFKYIKKSPEWDGFNLFGPSGDDPRVGLAAFQEGHPIYDKWKAKQKFADRNLFDFINGLDDMSMNKLMEEYPNREIPYELVKQIPDKLKMDKNNLYIKMLIKRIDDKKWYDFTGVLNENIIGESNLDSLGSGDIIFANASYVITKDGYLLSGHELSNYKDKIIDKVINTTALNYDFVFVTDVPDVRIGDWLDKAKYKEGKYILSSGPWISLNK